jgi:hypothetical protein
LTIDFIWSAIAHLAVLIARKKKQD